MVEVERSPRAKEIANIEIARAFLKEYFRHRHGVPHDKVNRQSLLQKLKSDMTALGIPSYHWNLDPADYGELPTGTIIRSGGFELYYDHNRIKLPNFREVELKPTETGMLYVFMSNPATVIHFPEFKQAFRNTGVIDDMGNFRVACRVYVGYVRGKIGDYHNGDKLKGWRYIKTIRERGYVWTAEDKRSA